MAPFARRLAASVGLETRTFVHWCVVHALPTLALRHAAKRGDLQADLIRVGRLGTGDVHEVIERIRSHGPMYGSSIGYVATSHDAVRDVLVSEDFRTGFPTDAGPIGKVASWSAPRTVHPVEPPSLLVTEPPDHARYRKLVTRVFTVRAVERLRGRTQQIADRLLDDLEAEASRPVELVEAYCALLPLTVIAEVLGVPERERSRVLEFGTAAAPSLDLGLGLRRYRRTNAALRSFDAWLGSHLDDLRRNPGDNLLSRLVAARDEEGALDERELKATAGLVLAAGFETTVNLLGNGIVLLREHDDQRARLVAEPELWPNAVEEVLRLDPPVLLTGRLAVRDTTVAGRRVGAGSMVTTILAGANRDPEVFADPLRFDVARSNAREHISFSAGRHHCLGAALARMEGEIGLRTIFERYPDLELLPGARRRQTRILRGYEKLPVLLRP